MKKKKKQTNKKLRAQSAHGKDAYKTTFIGLITSTIKFGQSLCSDAQAAPAESFSLPRGVQFNARMHKRGYAIRLLPLLFVWGK